MSVEESLEFQKALNKACEEQYKRFLKDPYRPIDTQRERIMIDPHLREITENLTRKYSTKEDQSELCPECGDSYHGNTRNGKPFCLKCDTRKSPKLKSYTFKELEDVVRIR